MKKYILLIFTALTLMVTGVFGVNNVYASGEVTITFHEQEIGDPLPRLNVSNMPENITAPGAIQFSGVAPPQSPNYTFGGFIYYDSDNNEKSLKAGDPVTESIDVYVRWTLTVRTVRYFNLEDAENHPDNPGFFYGTDDYYLKPATKEGFNFIGWWDNAAFNGEPVTYLGDGVKSKNLYAKWEDAFAIPEPTYTITTTSNTLHAYVINVDPLLYKLGIGTQHNYEYDLLPLQSDEYNDVGFSIEFDNKYHIRFNMRNEIYEHESNIVSFKIEEAGQLLWELKIYNSLNYTNLVKTYQLQDGDLSIEFFNIDLKPAINGNEHFATNVDDPDDIAYFLSHIVAIDDIDGNLSHLIVVEEDNYTGNEHILGDYDVTVSVTDSSHNKAEFTFWIHVVDVTPPTASADMSPKNISYDITLDVTALQNSIIISDNYYNLSELTITKTKDTYTANKTIIGSYEIEFTIADPSENETILLFEINVIDGVAPIINGITDLTKSYTRIMPLSEILEGITAADAVDGDLTHKIVVEEDTYTGNAHIVNRNGTYYKVVISVKDSANNKTTKTIKIYVVDDQSPNWYITNGITLNLSPGTPMTRSQIVDLLTRAGKIQSSPNARVTYTADTYSGNEETPGIYTLAFNVSEMNGNENDYTFAINVMSADSGGDIDIVPDQPNIFTSILNFFKTNGAYILVFGIAGVIIYLVLTNKKTKRRK